MAIASIFAPLAAGRYEIAIVVAQKKYLSTELAYIALIFSLVTFIIFSAFQVLLDGFLRTFFEAENTGNYFYFIPLIILLSSFLTICKNLANSRKKYKTLSYMLLTQSALTALLSICLGLFFHYSGINGLILASIISSILSSVAYAFIFKRDIIVRRMKVDRAKCAIIKKFRDFPLINAPGSLLNTFALSLPIILLTKHYNETIVGYYALLTQVVFAPLAFLSLSVSQVHLKKVSELISNKQNLQLYLFKVIALLTVIAAPPTLIFLFWAENIFLIFFGDEWQDAGKILSIMVPAFALKFIVSTISSTISATGYLKYYIVWVILDIGQIIFLFSYFVNMVNIYDFFGLMALFSFLSYFLYLVVIFATSAKVKQY